MHTGIPVVNIHYVMVNQSENEKAFLFRHVIRILCGKQKAVTQYLLSQVCITPTLLPPS